MTGSKLIAVVHETCERARYLRQVARESRWKAQAIKARARRLLVRVDVLENAAGTAAEIQPIETAIKPVRQLFADSRQELFLELKQSLHDLETLRMTPQDDPAVRELSAEIRQTIAQAPTFNRPRRTAAKFLGAPDRD